MEDNLNFSKMEDDLNFIKNGRQHHFLLNAINLFLVTASFLLKTFIGLAQLSKIYSFQSLHLFQECWAAQVIGQHTECWRTNPDLQIVVQVQCMPLDFD